jgi:hypothetical protein
MSKEIPQGAFVAMVTAKAEVKSHARELLFE